MARSTSKVAKKNREESGGAERRQQILQESARLFVSQGFDGTTMRDIANATGILAGSLYYHFPSKEVLFLTVHSEGMRHLTEALDAALEGVEDPWDRLEAACISHCQALAESNDLMVLVVPQIPEGLKNYARDLTAQRDKYEDRFRQLIADIDLPEDVSKTLFRLMLIGMLNWTQHWYRDSGPLSLKEIAQQFIAILRAPL